MRYQPTTRRCRYELLGLVAVVLLTGSVDVHTQAPATLDIYWIDVEGGAATLVITPERDTILMDALMKLVRCSCPSAPTDDRRTATRRVTQASVPSADILIRGGSVSCHNS